MSKMDSEEKHILARHLKPNVLVIDETIYSKESLHFMTVENVRSTRHSVLLSWSLVYIHVDGTQKNIFVVVKLKQFCFGGIKIYKSCLASS